MASLYFIDSNGTSHTIPGVKLGSRTGFGGNTGEVESIPNSSYTAVMMTRISREARTISLTIPVSAVSSAALETTLGEYLSWFRQTDDNGILQYNRDDGTSRKISVYIDKGYPVVTHESNTFAWLDVQFVACLPYWYAAAADTVADGTTYTNNGDYPAMVQYTATADTITLNGSTVIKAASGRSITGLKIMVNDYKVTVTDSSNVNCLYRCDLSSTFPMIPVGSTVVTGASLKVWRQWGSA